MKETNEYPNLDKQVLEELEKDFRIKRKSQLPAAFQDWIEYKSANKKVVELELWVREILNEQFGLSLGTLVRLIDRFTPFDKNTKIALVTNLLSDNLYVRAEIKFKTGTLEIDDSKTMLYLKKELRESRSNDNICYQ